MVTNTWTKTTSVAFNVLGAYGYPAKGHGRPRVWALAVVACASVVTCATYQAGAFDMPQYRVLPDRTSDAIVSSNSSAGVTPSHV